MTTRRQFLGALGAPALAPFVGLQPGALDGLLEGLPQPVGSPDEVAQDEDFWRQIAAAFRVDRSIVNFNNGGVSPAPDVVQDALRRHVEFSNGAPAYRMWRILEPQREGVRQQLAALAGCDPEEIAITRNASEGLQICQFGFDLSAGDEVLCTNQDYPRMLTTFEQRAAREGIVLETFSIPTPCADPQRIVELYRQNITPRTKLILVCHVINLTGQILPVREIVALGKERGIPVIIDGAHAFANLEFELRDLDCEFYATSLHKWLFAPIGTGMLYVKKERIGDLWPLMAAADKQRDDIRKFEEIGTHPAAHALAIADAISFHRRLGAARKFARLVWLRDRWARRLAAHDRVRLNTSLEPGAACGIANVAIDEVDCGALQQHLFRAHRIYTVAIRHEEFEGIRVSPSVYATVDEVDRFVDAMEAVVQHGLPS